MSESKSAPYPFLLIENEKDHIKVKDEKLYFVMRSQ